MTEANDECTCHFANNYRNSARVILGYFCALLCAECHENFFCDIMQALAVFVPSGFTVAKWHSEFQRWRPSCDDTHCHRHSYTSANTEDIKNHKPVMDDQRLSACVVADYVGISMGRVVFSTC